MTTTQQDTYTHRQLVKLLGLTESRGDAQITILDIISWMRDPGGDATWYVNAVENYPGEAWMSKRGPIAPDSPLACLVYDFFKGMKMLSLTEQGVIALTVFNFTPYEIAALIGISEQEVTEILLGRPKRKAGGEVVRDKRGRPVLHQGAITGLLHSMNGHSTNGNGKGKVSER